MFLWTYELGWFGFFVRILPAIMLFGVAATTHLALARKITADAPSRGLLAIFATDDELLEGGAETRMWALGFYAAAVTSLFLIMVLAGVPVGVTEEAPDTEQRSLERFRNPTKPRAVKALEPAATE